MPEYVVYSLLVSTSRESRSGTGDFLVRRKVRIVKKPAAKRYSIPRSSCAIAAGLGANDTAASAARR